ncbi:MAG: hypothetical protein WKH97_06725 [Casimicrobiaceae bacterium]
MTKKGPPASNEQEVAVDLNNPEFLRSWFSLKDKNESARVLHTLEKVTQLTWAQVYQDAGLKWERITHPPLPLPAGIDAVYSIRVTPARCAIVFRQQQSMRFLLIAEDHDATYPKGKKK